MAPMVDAVVKLPFPLVSGAPAAVPADSKVDGTGPCTSQEADLVGSSDEVVDRVGAGVCRQPELICSHATGQRIVSASTIDNVIARPPVIVSAPEEPMILKPSVCCPRLSVVAAVSVTFSMPVIWPSPVSSKLAPMFSVSVPPPPASRVSFWAPMMVSFRGTAGDGVVHPPNR